ncbi:diphthine--ammonia ligase [Candidatus Altiarchaeota archaeon]
MIQVRLCVLFSGGKDSCMALHKSAEYHEVACLVSIISENPESYMYHTPNINVAELQAEAMGLPLIRKTSKGVKEEELGDLRDAICRARDEYGIEGVVTGAIESVYQAQRIQDICSQLDLWCFNPLWLADQEGLMRDVISSGFKAIISGAFAYPLGKEWLGRLIDDDALAELLELRTSFGISPSGEGGEIETTVLDAPFFHKYINIVEASPEWDGDSGVYRITRAELMDK